MSNRNSKNKNKQQNKNKITKRQLLQLMTAHKPRSIHRSVTNRRERKVRAPLAVGRSTTNRGGKSRFLYSNSEFVTIVQDTNVFGANEIKVNPGLPASFPWLSGIAKNFEFYKFHNIRYNFVSVVSANTDGEFWICPEYDVNDAPPDSMQTVYATTGHCTGNVWLQHSMRINPKYSRQGVNQQWHKVRDGEVIGDNVGYDIASIYYGMAPTSTGSAATVGRLEVTYDVEFFVPQNSLQHAPEASQTTFFKGSGTKSVAGAASISFGIEDMVRATNGLGLTNLSASEVRMLKGMYKLAAVASAYIPSSAIAAATVEFKRNGTTVMEVPFERTNPEAQATTVSANVERLVAFEDGDILTTELVTGIPNVIGVDYNLDSCVAQMA